MEQLTEDYMKAFLTKEWLPVVDSPTSTPYLIKFCYVSDSSCGVLVTDTRSAWAEVLTRTQIARRWQSENPQADALPPVDELVQQDSWMKDIMTLLSNAHSLGGFSEMIFEVVEAKCGDLAFTLECESFRWRWEAVFVGYRNSADIISKQLILPLISFNHLALSSTSIVGEMSADELGKAVDRVGRIARRATDIHIKNALSKPRVASAISRMSAVFNLIPDVPNITLQAESVDLHVPRVPVVLPSRALAAESAIAGQYNDSSSDVPAQAIAAENRSISVLTSYVQAHEPIAVDSATESESDDPPVVIHSAKGKEKAKEPPAPESQHIALESRNRLSPLLRASTPPRASKAASAESDSSPSQPPAKRAKSSPSPDGSDSEEDRRRHVSRVKSGAAARGAPRQPIKRGGKRF